MLSWSAPSHRRHFAGAAAVMTALALAAPATAQIAAPHAHWELYPLRSGVLANPYPIETVVFRQIVSLPQNTPWLRLYFDKAQLGKGSYLRISSLADGDVLTMQQQHLEQWGFTSTYFNGNTVLLEIVAGPNTGKNYVEIAKIWAGDDPAAVTATDTICGSNDDRVPSSNAAVGRLDVGCTGWIISAPASGNDKVHLTAGHCFPGATVLEFNVPSSNSNCSLQHPPASRQFAVDTASVVFVNGGIGNDFAVYRCFPNPNTNLTTFQQQGAAITLATSMPAVNSTLRVTGFGLDGSNVTPGSANSCNCSSGAGTGSRNQTQQTHTGPLNGTTASAANYAVDTCGGNSGSPVFNDATGEAIAIHTHGGCTTSSGSGNSGTLATYQPLRNAILTVGGGGGGSSNDDCANAIAVVDGVNPGFSNVGATTSAPAWPCGTGAADVWFVYTATCSGAVAVDTCGAGTNFDTTLEVFSGNCGSLVSQGCNDDTCGLHSSVTAIVTAGNTYYIRVGGYSGATGSFDLTVTGCNAADECTGAIPLRIGANGLFTNALATTSAMAWSCGSNTGNDLWFAYQVTAPAVVTFDTCSANTDFDTVMQVFSGSCGSLNLLACNDDMGAAACPSSSLRSRVTVAVPQPTTLLVRVGGYNSLVGRFDVNVAQAPPNGDCATAIVATNGINGPFANLGGSVSTPGWSCVNGGADVWFSYTATCTGVLIADTCSPLRDFDTTMEIYQGSCGSLSSIGCNDDACGLGSSLTVAVTQGLSYMIRVGGYFGAQGNFELAVACVPPNDDCASAVTVSEGLNGPFSNVGATTSAPAWACAAGGSDVWFAFTSPCTAPVTFKTCTVTRTFDTAIEAFSGSCAGGLTSLGCNDDSCGSGSQLTVPLTMGQTCLIRVGGFNGTQGNFDFVVEMGTGAGNFGTLPTGCGAMTLTAAGAPHINGQVQFSLNNVQSLPFLLLGFGTNPAPICPPASCQVGPIVSNSIFGSSLNVTIPCNPVLIGAGIAVQGADLFAPGGCSTFVLTLTDTVVMTIG